MTQGEIENIAKTAAHAAVIETLTTLGFDTKDPFQIQKDQSFLRTMRVGTYSGLGIGLKTIIGMVVTAGAGWLWLAFNRPN